MAETVWASYWKTIQSNHIIEQLIHRWKVSSGYARFISYIPKGTVLEVGCGEAHISNLLRKQGRAVTTSDIDPQHYPDYIADTFCLPFPSNSYDIVMSTGLLEHFDEASIFRAVQEQARVARRAVIINVPLRFFTWPLLWNARRFLGASLHMHFNLMSVDEWRAVLHPFRFKANTLWFGPFPYICLTLTL